ncbi:hypothetical protein D3C87_1363620 [compost metagenome]
MDGGARALQPGPPQGASRHRRRSAASGDDRLQGIAAQSEVDGAVGRGLAGVDAGRAVELAAIEGEGDRVELQNPVLQVGPEADLADIKGVGPDRAGAVGQSSVHRPEPFSLQRRIRQELAGRARGRHRPVAGDPRPSAQDGGEVVDVQSAGDQFRVDAAALADLVHLQASGQVGGSDPPAEIGEAEQGAVAAQIAPQSVGRRVGRGDPGQEIDVGQVLALKL